MGVVGLWGHSRRGGRSRRARKSAVIGASNYRSSQGLRSQCIEALEARLLLAGHPVITEFEALNDNGRVDRYGSHSDWIEVYNPYADPVSLTGYYLTDNAENLTKWQFPAVTLQPNGYVVVVASGRDERDPNLELHTSFDLDHTGEYLGLVAPDGQTVVSAYDPQYPHQVADMSYGRMVSRAVTNLVPANTTVKVLVPTDGSLAETWTAVDFDDGTWLSGTTGVGYDLNGNPDPAPAGFNVRMVDTAGGTDGVISNIADAQAILNGTAPVGAFTIAYDNFNSLTTYPVVNFGSGGSFGSDRTLPNGAKPTDSTTSAGREQYALRATAYIFIPAGTWTIDVGGDDGFMLRIPGVTFTGKIGENFTGTTSPSADDTIVYGGIRGHSHTMGTFTVPTGGLSTTLTLDYFECTGGDDLELSVAAGAVKTFNTTAFGLLSDGVPVGWSVSTGPLVPPGYGPLIKTDVQSQMYGKTTSAYMRLPFSTPTPWDFDSLRLKVKYDDGFVAFINGQEVARRNAPDGDPAWNWAASQDRPDADALVYEMIDIPVTPGLLKQGSNVLAIQGLNRSADSSDFLVMAELEGSMLSVGDPRFFQTPTPGAANDPTGMSEVVQDTKFDHDRGFYSAPFDLVLSTATQGAQIRYTLDGSLPTATMGLVYSTPLHITGTSTVRAAGFKPGALPTDVDTQTYIFVDDVVRQSPYGQKPGAAWPNPGRQAGAGQIIDYGMDPNVLNSASVISDAEKGLTSIPTFSVVMDLNDLFNPSTSPDTGGFYVNPAGDGQIWERKASIELINPDGSKGFQINGGVRVRGGYSRDPGNPKHGLHFFFRDDEGYGGKLHYDMFGDEGADTFERFDLRCGQNYSWSYGGDPSYIAIRDQFSRTTMGDMGDPTAHGQFYHLYINGQYWGLYDTDERPDAYNAAQILGGTKDEYDVIKVDPDLGYNIEAIDGNLNAWTDMWNQVRGDMTNIANYMRVRGKNPDGTRNPAYPELLDVDNLIDYMLVIYWGGNLDAPLSNFLGNSSPNNFFAVRSRNGTSGGFKFYVHDAEHTLLNVNEDRTGPYNSVTSVGKSNPQSIFELLERSPEFRLHVADRIHEFMFNDGALTVAKNTARFSALRDEISAAMVDESARWGDSKTEPPLTRSNWQSEINRILSGYIPQRTGIVLGQLKNDNLYPRDSRLAAPEFGQHGGTITNTYRLTIMKPGGEGTIYYTLDGSDPRPVGGGAPTGAAQAYSAPVSLAVTATVNARVRLSDGSWSPLTTAQFTVDLSSMRITEFMYNPAPPPAGSPYTADDFEFVELMNLSGRPVDMTGLSFTRGIAFTFPTMTLSPGQRVVLVSNQEAFESRYGVGSPIAGVFSGHLDDTSARVTLAMPDGSPVVDFTYSDKWYPITDGGGYSMVVNTLSVVPMDLNDPGSWRPSYYASGAPGLPDPGYSLRSIAINEVMTSTDQPSGDWIEIYNSTNSAVDLGGWFLSDDASNLTKYTIPAGTILPSQDYIVFNQAAHFGNATIPGNTPFELSATGGSAFLTSPDGQGGPGGYREEQDFDAAEKEITFGRYTKSTGTHDFTALSAPTAGALNALPRVGPVVINEIMYNPTGSGYEWVELKNITGSDLALDNPADPSRPWQFTAGIDFSFPKGASIPAFGYALVVPIDPVTFRSLYNVPAETPIFGPFTGRLDNAGEDVTISGPGEEGGYVRIDRVRYNNKSPWPTDADGHGASLSKTSATSYGNDPMNWAAGANGGTPGRPNGQEPPIVDLGADAVIYAGATFNRLLTFYDPNAGQSWTAGVNWGEQPSGETLAINQAAKSFTLSHQYAMPGTYTITVRVADNAGGAGIDRLTLTVLPQDRQGSAGDDTYTLRLDPSGAYLQFFEGITTDNPPSFSILSSAMPPLVIHGNGGNDSVTIDFTYGNPIPSGGLLFDGGDGNDVLNLSYRAGDPHPQAQITFSGGAGANSLDVMGSPGADSVTFAAGQVSFGGLNVTATNLASAGFEGMEGDDTLTLDGSLGYAAHFAGGSGSDTLVVLGGSQTLADDLGAGAENVNVQVKGSGRLTFGASQHLASLSLSDSARAVLAANGARVLRVRGLSIGADAQLDIADNDLIVQAAPGAGGEVFNAVNALVSKGAHGGEWTGLGIVSSSAAADALDPNAAPTAVGIMLNNRDGAAALGAFAGEAVDADCILIRHTYAGDSDLNGRLDADDYFRIDRGLLKGSSGFANGDSNYSGAVDADDFAQIDRAYMEQRRALAEIAPKALVAKPAAATVIKTVAAKAKPKPAHRRKTVVKRRKIK